MEIFFGDFFLESFPWLNRVWGGQSRPVQISEPPAPNRQTPLPSVFIAVFGAQIFLPIFPQKFFWGEI